MAYAYWVIAGLWLLWAAYWMASARRTKQSAQAEATPSRLMHLALLTAAFALLALPAFEIGFLQWRLLPSRVIVFVTGVVLEALGLGFAVWARVHLGQYWSSTIDIKPEHQLISSGPYVFVRHPIYTGLVLAFLGTALAEDEISGLLALAPEMLVNHRGRPQGSPPLHSTTLAPTMIRRGSPTVSNSMESQLVTQKLRLSSF